jgi:hypothetical protein
MTAESSPARAANRPDRLTPRFPWRALSLSATKAPYCLSPDAIGAANAMEASKIQVHAIQRDQGAASVRHSDDAWPAHAAARAAMGPGIALCMKIQLHSAPNPVVKTATTARELFEAETAPSSAGAPLNTIVRAEPFWLWVVVRTKSGPQSPRCRNRREDDAVLWGACFAAAANATFSPSTRFCRAPAPAGDGPRSSARCGARTP